MIRSIHIANYKSVRDLEMELGQFNVLIGENGCGKTNILEAISLGAAAASDKLDHEFLASRGIRVADPDMMRSAFPADKATEAIEIMFSGRYDVKLRYKLNNTGEPYAKWKCEPDATFADFVAIPNLAGIPSDDEVAESYISALSRAGKIFTEVVTSINALARTSVPEPLGSEIKDVENNLRKANDVFLQSLAPIHFGTGILDFILYSPENSALRIFESEGQIQPLGIRGEGLFKLLRVFSQREGQPELKKLNELLGLIDWFEEFQIPNDLSNGQRHITLNDRFLTPGNGRLDQRSANEGFLFLLFYFALFLSPETPSFFAIDNIDASLNPKLCSVLVQRLVELSKEHGKQVIVTTHNPALLDGLNLNDPDQRLMVVSRNRKGVTRVRRVEPPQTVPGEEPVRLSEAFLRGYLGGLPVNF